ncbi:dihydroorotase [Xylanibacter muris]|uniref:Dihydroorotase n=1 Tax=Xylanibacter muris TaxID=2736290 RepID=A0ABX2AS03_9BACT|nr:dihydroorotase [Xylanibacter muris]NPD92812.1 dihydroorotase [Xylanibacter muris]
MRILIKNAKIVNEGKTVNGSIAIDGEYIADDMPGATYDEIIDAVGCFVLPGVIDTHVHFREPGLTGKADIESETCAAAAGGVTSYFDMPNTVPNTTTLEALDDKFRLAAEKSHVNYSFFFGATNDNVGLFGCLDVHRVPGIKLFMGSSTGNMLVDRDSALTDIFSKACVPVVVHCEDTGIINANMASAKEKYGEDPDVSHHPEIRSAEACYQSTLRAVNMAREHGTRLHVAHLSTDKELGLFAPGESQPRITAEAVVGHLLFSDADYGTLGTRIKVNPSVKTLADRDALRKALADGRITVVATDHAPHLLEQKAGGCAKAASGMPMIQFSLPSMLQLVDEGGITVERLVELMCHNPARLFEVSHRGYLRSGYKADIVIVRPDAPWTVTKDIIQSKCGWSPLEGHTFNWKVERTICNGHTVYSEGTVDRSYIGEQILFRKN